MSARAGVLVVERTDRAFVRVYGRDPVKMMQGLITNDLANAPPLRTVYAGMLTAKGKLIADLRALRIGNDVLIEASALALENILGNFKKYVPPLFARAEQSAAWRGLTLTGPGAPRMITEVFGELEVPLEEDASIEAGGLRFIRTEDAGPGTFDVIGPPDLVGEALEKFIAAGAVAGDLEQLEVLRIEAGRPRWGAELDETVIPLEAGLRKHMISETKGCYTGQEVIIRILHRGHVNRTLRGFLLGETAPPAHNTPIFSAEGKDVGRITSACVSPKLGQVIGLGYARRELLLPGDVAVGSVDGPHARVIELPFTND